MPEKTSRRRLNGGPRSRREKAASLLEPWIRVLGPLLGSEETCRVLHFENPRELVALQREGRLLTLDSFDGEKLHPAFQFNPAGKPYPEVARVIEIFSGAVESPYTIASWFVSPQDLLDDKTPAAWMQQGGDPSLLFEAARRAAWRLAQ
jgi:hypothetical protein